MQMDENEKRTLYLYLNQWQRYSCKALVQKYDQFKNTMVRISEDSN